MSSPNRYLTQIEQGALRRGLDPAAVASVASVEGGFGGPTSKPGDSGTSFGPFQLHIGGALPKGLSGQAAQSFAWSTGGIDYALNGIAKVAHGLGGEAAVSSIVQNFERPTDPTSEIKRALANYNQFQGGASVPVESGSAADALSRTGGDLVPQPVKDLVAAPVKLAEFLGKLADPNLWIRVLEIVGGSVVALAGLYLLVKQVGLSPETVSSLRSTPVETMAQEGERVSSEGFRKGFVQGQREAGRSAGRKAGRSVVV